MTVLERALRAQALLYRAAFSLESWEAAIASFAEATGSRTGQIIGLGTPSGVAFNVMTEVNPQALREFVAVGGGDPFVNSRVRVGLKRPEMIAFDDAHLTPDVDRARSPEFAAWLDRHRMGYSRFLNLIRRDDTLIGAGIVRDPDQAEMSGEEKRVFALLTQTMRSAVEAQLALESEQAKLVAGSFESMERAVFVCAPQGRIIAHSATAGLLLAERRWFDAPEGILRPLATKAGGLLEEMIARACTRDFVSASQDGSLVLHDSLGVPMLVRVIPYPAAEMFRLQRAALVIPHAPTSGDGELAARAKQMFNLTPSEANIVVHVVRGRRPDAIAQQMGIKPATVRSHLKRIFVKTGVRSQVELAALRTLIQ